VITFHFGKANKRICWARNAKRIARTPTTHTIIIIVNDNKWVSGCYHAGEILISLSV